MADIDPYSIYSVAVDPKYCPQCGTKLEIKELSSSSYQFCSNCEMIFARNPLSATHVVVKRDNKVLLLDEPIPQHEGLWSLPGGHASYKEGPREAVLRELQEETGLTAEPSDLTLLTVIHAETTKMAFHFITYTLDYSDTVGEFTPEAEGFEIEFVPIKDLSSNSDRIRKNDLERIELAFGK